MLSKWFAPVTATALVLTSCPVVWADENPETFFGGVDNDVYLKWWNDEGSDKYTHSVYMYNLDESDGLAAHWYLDEDNLYLAAAAKATGWVAFGIGEAGGMRGADMVIFQTAKPDTLLDAYTLEALLPLEDDCQNWHFLSSISEDGMTIFEGYRKINTTDPQDRVILDDSRIEKTPTRVIGAWGDSESYSYHGQKRAREAVRFFGDESGDLIAFADAMESAEGYFDVVATNYTVQAQETQYVVYCVSEESLAAQGVPIDQELHIIGFEPIITEKNVPYVHHFITRASLEPHNEFGLGPGCGKGTKGMFSEVFIEQSYGWAVGQGPTALPDFLGQPLMGSTGYRSYSIEVHYHNPTGIQGFADGSGARFYYTSQLRETEVGVMTIGDISLKLRNEPVGDGLTEHIFHCPGTCSFVTITEPITIFQEYIHSHASTVAAQTQVIRDDQVIQENKVDFWDFDQQGNFGFQHDDYTIEKGDEFKTICKYRATNGETFGSASGEEMCISFIWYYPRQLSLGKYPIICGYDLGTGICDTDYTVNTLTNEDELNRNFGITFESAVQMGRLAVDDSTSLGTCPVDEPSAATTTTGFTLSILLTIGGVLMFTWSV